MFGDGQDWPYRAKAPAGARNRKKYFPSYYSYENIREEGFSAQFNYNERKHRICSGQAKKDFIKEKTSINKRFAN